MRAQCGRRRSRRSLGAATRSSNPTGSRWGLLPLMPRFLPCRTTSPCYKYSVLAACYTHPGERLALQP